jgi:hypothetical protein
MNVTMELSPFLVSQMFEMLTQEEIEELFGVVVTKDAAGNVIQIVKRERLGRSGT